MGGRRDWRMFCFKETYDVIQQHEEPAASVDSGFHKGVQLHNRLDGNLIRSQGFILE